MIARIWTAKASRDRARLYAAHLRDAVLPIVQRLPGYKGARLLEREQGGSVEIIVTTWWRSLDDVRAFAGPDPGRAVVADAARAMLDSWDEEVRHYDVAFVDDPTS